MKRLKCIGEENAFWKNVNLDIATNYFGEYDDERYKKTGQELTDLKSIFDKLERKIRNKKRII